MTDDLIARLRDYQPGNVLALLEEAAEALAAASRPQQEDLDYVQVLKRAKAIVNASVLYRRFIDGTPLENDLAVWMTDFAFEAVKLHGQHVAGFLNELYAVMVDPCAEGMINVAEMKAALLAAAGRDRNAQASVPPAAPPPWQPIEAFIQRVNARAEADMLQGRPITGAHHRAIETELALLRALPSPPASAPQPTMTKDNDDDHARVDVE